MDDEVPKIIMSPLCQNISRDGVTVKIEIYRGEDDHGWILEVVDHEGASTVFDDKFKSDRAAFDAFMQVIDDEGIRTFVDDRSGTIH